MARRRNSGGRRAVAAAVLATAAVAASSAAADAPSGGRPASGSGLCRSSGAGGLTFNPWDVPLPLALTSCPAQSAFTCCGAEHDISLAKFETACRLTAEAYVSPATATRCCARWLQLRCYGCAGVATAGQAAGVCRSTCDAAYDACAEVMVAWDAAGSPDLCTADSLACARLRDVAPDGAAFCSAAGVPVAAEGAVAPCYDGRAMQPSPALREAVVAALSAAANTDAASSGSSGGASGSGSGSGGSGSGAAGAAAAAARQRRAAAHRARKAGVPTDGDDSDDVDAIPPWLLWLLGLAGVSATNHNWPLLLGSALGAALIATWLTTRCFKPAPAYPRRSQPLAPPPSSAADTAAMRRAYYAAAAAAAAAGESDAGGVDSDSDLEPPDAARSSGSAPASPE